MLELVSTILCCVILVCARVVHTYSSSHACEIMNLEDTRNLEDMDSVTEEIELLSSSENSQKSSMRAKDGELLHVYTSAYNMYFVYVQYIDNITEPPV